MFRAAAVPTLPKTLRRASRAARVALACSAAVLLASCGGGDRAEEYRPDRVVVFGDENSAFRTVSIPGGGQIEGLVYSVNTAYMGPIDATHPGSGSGFCDIGTATDRCDLSSSSSADDFYNISKITAAYAVTSGEPPLGTGQFLTPTPNEPLTLNVVHMVGTGTMSYEDAATPTPNAFTAVTVKRDLRIQYLCNDDVTVVQRIAHTFGKGFSDECVLDSGGAKTYASAGAKIDVVQAQVNQARNEGQWGKGSLVVVWIGQNDIMEIAADTTVNVTLDAKRKEAKVRADRLAQVVKQIIGSGAKVLVIGVADLSYSPWATDPTAPPDRVATVRALVDDFNKTLVDGYPKTEYKGLGSYSYRGKDYTFIDTAELTRLYAGNSSFKNQRACALQGDVTPTNGVLPSVSPTGAIASDVEVEFCTTGTLVEGGNANTYLWADDYRLGRPIHRAVADAALSRAINQF